MRAQYNYDKLRGLIREHFGTNKAYAEALGISQTTLYTRLANETSFTQEEMRVTSKLFNINSPEERDKIFFTTN